MEPHQQRVIEERDELAERIKRLEDFLSSERSTPQAIGGAELGRLGIQLHIMRAYLRILEERIVNFEGFKAGA